MEIRKKNWQEIPLSQIRIKDAFWNRYVRLVREVLLPYQWEILNDRLDGVETSHCISNFKIAAKEAEGEFEGAVFQDTDAAKWLEAAAYALETAPDEELQRLADETIALIGRAQCEDGYLNTYYTIKYPELRWTNLKEGHELYTAGHMIEAAVAYYQATKKENFLQIAERLAQLICDVFGKEEGKCHGYPGHQEIELALVRLYEITGNEAYARTAKYFIDERGRVPNYFLEEEKKPAYRNIFPEFAAYDTKYSQSHLPVRQQETAEGHAVRAVYMYCAMADLAWLYDDVALMDACKALWKDMTKRRMYITGGIGSSGLLERFTTDYDLPNDCNYSETCASIGLALFGRRMAGYTKEASYMDAVERALYNTVLSGIALDGKSFFYVNPLEVWPESCMDRTYREHVKPVRQPWFGVACCPPNIARTLASLGHYIYFTDEQTLYVNLYISNETTVSLPGGQAVVRIESDLTVSGRVKLMADTSDRKAPMEIALRIPSYAGDYTVRWKKNDDERMTLKKGYACIALPGGSRTEIEIDLDIHAQFVRANPKVRTDSGKAAIVKGPLVYCLEEADNGKNLQAIFVDTAQELTEVCDETLGGSVRALTFLGYRMKESWTEDILYSAQSPEFEKITCKAVPYHVWGNRAPGEMLVWIGELLHPKEESDREDSLRG